ncbi:unnamed protein product [Cuscuta epithymum]|uniref:Uncharacterized protein n=1 Tax=Cuscuta epithymum TaxID=186058 RepID=A0AAV0C317_9ASTE|nr:unnamed protein product [Cuscuta epithymum]
MNMLLKGQETDKYFTKEFDLYQINKVCSFANLLDPSIYYMCSSHLVFHYLYEPLYVYFV